MTEMDEFNSVSETEANTQTTRKTTSITGIVTSQNGTTKQSKEAYDDTLLGSKKVYKKTSADNKLVLYLCERDLVIREGKINKLHGVLVVDTEYLDKQQIIGQISLTFRYGREDEEVMGLKFCNEAIMCLTQLYPPYPQSCDNAEGSDSSSQFRNPVQIALLKRLGTNAFPFTMEITPLAPPSVQLLPVKEYNGAQIGTCYEIRAYLANYVDEKKYRDKMVRMGIRVIQVPTIQQKRINRDWLEKRHLFRMLHKGRGAETERHAKVDEKDAGLVSDTANVAKRALQLNPKDESDEIDSDIDNFDADDNDDDYHDDDGDGNDVDDNKKEGIKNEECVNTKGLEAEEISMKMKESENEDEQGSANKFLKPFLRRNFSDFKNRKKRENHKLSLAEAPPTASPPSMLRSSLPPEQQLARLTTSLMVLSEMENETDLLPSSETIDKPFLLSDGRIKLQAELNKSAYMQNEPINVSLTITNNSNRSVRGIKILVVQNVDVCMFSNGKFKNVLSGQTSKDIGPIGPERTFKKTYQIRAQRTNAAKNWIALEDLSSLGQRGTVATDTNKATVIKSAANVADSLTCGNGIPLSPTVMPYSERNFDEPNVFSIYVSYYVQVKVLMSKMMMSSRHLTVKLPFILLPSIVTTKTAATPVTTAITEAGTETAVAEKREEKVTSSFDVDADVHHNS